MYGSNMMMTPMDMIQSEMQDTFDYIMMANSMDSCLSTTGSWITKEQAMKRSLNRILSYENYLNRCIKEYECQTECFKSKKSQLECYKQDIMKKMEMCNEEMKKCSTTGMTPSNPSILKKVFCRTPEMEMEEQYDSIDPSKCYRVIRKNGESPQMISGPEYMNMGSMMGNMISPMMGNMMSPMMGNMISPMMGNMMSSMMGNMMYPMMGNMMSPMMSSMMRPMMNPMISPMMSLMMGGPMMGSTTMGSSMNPMMSSMMGPMSMGTGMNPAMKSMWGSMMGPMITNKGEVMEPLGGDLDEKFYKLCCMCGCCTKELRDMVMQYKDMTVGQLYDKACEMKMCCDSMMSCDPKMSCESNNPC